MSNVVSNSYKQYLAASWLTDNIKLVLLSSAYVYSSAHANLSDIAAGIVATSGNLASKTSAGGLLIAANVVFAALTGAAVTQMWIYHDTGTAGTSTLEITSTRRSISRSLPMELTARSNGQRQASRNCEDTWHLTQQRISRR